jgi:hypothetical protein
MELHLETQIVLLQLVLLILWIVMELDMLQIYPFMVKPMVPYMHKRLVPHGNIKYTEIIELVK